MSLHFLLLVLGVEHRASQAGQLFYEIVTLPTHSLISISS